MDNKKIFSKGDMNILIIGANLAGGIVCEQYFSVKCILLQQCEVRSGLLVTSSNR